MGWAIHLHLLAAVSWIGGSVFLFVLGISLRDKNDQKEVYPRIGPIYGFFEITALFLLLISGTIMIFNNGLVEILFDMDIHNKVIDSLRIKLIFVGILAILTVLHTIIALKTLHTEKTKLEKFFSRGASMGIFFLNFVVLHFAIIIRDIL
ncbi:hypothetical protein MNB_SV-9-726 [hydrothermal vent metagenome]|uniref:Copper resistance protein D domain-containing protein n=1 Tax=hydrothermal vent metagenome TaxID=652676 RepID=A0A1W1C0B2_9ZZZZ